MKLKRRTHPGEDLCPHGVLVVRQPRLPDGRPWPDVDIVIWEKSSERTVRLHDGIVAIEMTPGHWWVHGELLHYARSWPAMERWATSDNSHTWQGQRVLTIVSADMVRGGGRGA